MFNRWNAGGLAAWFREHCYNGDGYRSQHKKLPGILQELSTRQLRLFLDTYGDKTHTRNAGRSFFSSSKSLIDGLQQVLLKIGKRGSIYTRRPSVATMRNGHVIRSKMAWTLKERERDTLSISRHSVSWEPAYAPERRAERPPIFRASEGFPGSHPSAFSRCPSDGKHVDSPLTS